MQVIVQWREHPFMLLAESAREGNPDFGEIDRGTCLRVTREFVQQRWKEIRAHHDAGESGVQLLEEISQTVDELVKGAMAFSLFSNRNRKMFQGNVSLCALGGYGRNEMCPSSDIDLCLLFEGKETPEIRTIGEYFLPFMWDLGFVTSYATHTVEEAVQLVESDPEMFTSYSTARHLLGDTSTTARLKMALTELRKNLSAKVVTELRGRLEPELMPNPDQDLYRPEPNVKETAGGLRDYHSALWLLFLGGGPATPDEMKELGQLEPQEHLNLMEALDFLWHIRIELHFLTGKNENKLTFERQRLVAKSLGYGEEGQDAIDRFMQDYFNAARVVRGFLMEVARLGAHPTAGEVELKDTEDPSTRYLYVKNNKIHAGTKDTQCFAENPVRLMEVYWESARKQLPVSANTQKMIQKNLHLVGESYRSNDMVRRYFVAICNRPLQAGYALRQMHESGLLAAYIPEFGAVSGIVRYADFHSFPVDEHTLRAVEAIHVIPDMQGGIGQSFQRTLEHLHHPYILIISLLFHDLGKVSGEKHVEEGVMIAQNICERMGMSEEDTEQICFLVRHHMLMNEISMYRDTDDFEVVHNFAEEMKSEDRLRALLLLSYADLAAVGPNVWNEWKGALLIKLYLRSERILQGRDEGGQDIPYWTWPKADHVRELVSEPLKASVEKFLRDMGERYFATFSAEHISMQMLCLEEARNEKLGMRLGTHPDANLSEIVVCTQDRPGLFADLAGCLAGNMMNVQSASIFTTPDGFAIDSFVVAEAVGGRAVTQSEFEAFCKLTRKVLLDREEVSPYVEKARRRIFGLLRPRVPVRSCVEFDNNTSSTNTVVDIEAADRTGLLYDIARVFTDHGISIQSSRIVTDARRVKDAFYVRLNNGKVADNNMLESLRADLLQAVTSLPVA